MDAKLRVATRAHIAQLQRRLGVTTVYVTHDQVEAMTMGDRVCVLKDGLLQQVDTPLNLYDKPRNAFVADFIGSPAMNLFSVDKTSDEVKVGTKTVQLERATMERLGGAKTATIGVRPEAFKVVSEQDEGLAVTVGVVEELGADAFLYATMNTDGGETMNLVARVDARKRLEPGQTVRLAVDPEDVHLFDTETGERVV